jgi:hypothetical protein
VELIVQVSDKDAPPNQQTATMQSEILEKLVLSKSRRGSQPAIHKISRRKQVTASMNLFIHSDLNHMTFQTF